MSLREDLISLGLTLPESFDLESLAASLGDAPLRNTTALVGLSAVLFFLAERGRNPKVHDLCDALVYCSTCISVGYADIFAKTPIGKLVGSALMTIGPALSGRALDGRPKVDQTQEQILDTLRRILANLEAKPPA
jgi:hypothetical protein